MDARICDDQVRLFDVLGEGMHPTTLETYGVGRTGCCCVQSRRFSVRHLLGQLRQREQLVGGGVASTGVQDGTNDRARRGCGGTQAAFVGDVAVCGDLEGLGGASREFPGRFEGLHDAGEPWVGLVHGAPVVEAVQPRGAGNGGCCCVHRQVVQRHGHGGMSVHDGVFA